MPTAWKPSPNPSIERSERRSYFGVTNPSGDAMAMSADPATARTTVAEARLHTPQPRNTVATAQQ